MKARRTGFSSVKRVFTFKRKRNPRTGCATIAMPNWQSASNLGVTPYLRCSNEPFALIVVHSFSDLLARCSTLTSIPLGTRACPRRRSARRTVARCSPTSLASHLATMRNMLRTKRCGARCLRTGFIALRKKRLDDQTKRKFTFNCEMSFWARLCNFLRYPGNQSCISHAKSFL